MAKINARNRLTRTPFQIEQGKKYRFVSQGTWFDSKQECAATGYRSAKLRYFEWMRRMPAANWFSLIGRIDNKKGTQFDIGSLIEKDEVFSAITTGTLYCFANDVWFMYWNNKGFVDLEMQSVE